MYLDLISGINPFEIFLLFTAGGFLIGYMVGITSGCSRIGGKS